MSSDKTNIHRFKRLGFFVNSQQRPRSLKEIQVARVYFRIGTNCLFKKKSAKKYNIIAAKQFYKKALMHDPRYINAWIRLGDCQKFLHHHEQALNSYQQAVKLLPRSLRKFSAFLYRKIGKCYLDVGDRNKAIQAYKNAITKDFLNPSNYFKIAKCFKAKGDYASVLIYCFKAIYLAKNKTQFAVYNKLLTTAINQLNSKEKAANNFPLEMTKTRSRLMYWGLANDIGFDADLAQEIIKRHLFFVDHEMDLVAAAEQKFDVVSMGLSREAIETDFTNDTFAKKMDEIFGLQKFFKSFSSHDLLTNLLSIVDLVHKQIHYKDFQASQLKNKLMMLYDFNSKTFAVCRHMALHVGYILTQAILHKLLPYGSVYTLRNSVNSKAHGWCVYETADKKHVFLLDATLSAKSGKRVYDLKNLSDRCDIVSLYAKSNMLGLLNDCLIYHEISVPTAQQLEQRIKELQDEKEAAENAPTQPLE